MKRRRRKGSSARREYAILMVAFGIGLIAAMIFSARFALFLAAVALIYYGITTPRC